MQAAFYRDEEVAEERGAISFSTTSSNADERQFEPQAMSEELSLLREEYTQTTSEEENGGAEHRLVNEAGDVRIFNLLDDCESGRFASGPRGGATGGPSAREDAAANKPPPKSVSKEGENAEQGAPSMSTSSRKQAGDKKKNKSYAGSSLKVINKEGKHRMDYNATGDGGAAYGYNNGGYGAATGFQSQQMQPMGSQYGYGSASNPGDPKGKLSTGAIVGISVGSAVGLFLLIWGLWFLCIRGHPVCDFTQSTFAGAAAEAGSNFAGFGALSKIADNQIQAADTLLGSGHPSKVKGVKDRAACDQACQDHPHCLFSTFYGNSQMETNCFLFSECIVIRCEDIPANDFSQYKDTMQAGVDLIQSGATKELHSDLICQSASMSNIKGFMGTRLRDSSSCNECQGPAITPSIR